MAEVSAIRVARKSGRVAVVDDHAVINEHCARFLDRVAIRGLSQTRSFSPVASR
jgi:hypothetical protein